MREAPLTGNVFAHLCSKPSLSNSKCQPAPASMTAKPSLPSRQQASRQKASQQAHHPCRQASLPAFQSASQQASQPCLQTASRPASQPAQPDSQLVSQPASQPAIQGKLEAERLQKVFRGCLTNRNFGRTGKHSFQKYLDLGGGFLSSPQNGIRNLEAEVVSAPGIGLRRGLTFFGEAKKTAT